MFVLGVTVMVAGLVVTVPPPLVNSALTCPPSKEPLRGPTVSEVERSERSVHVFPPSPEYCHCTFVATFAPAVKVRLPPAGTDWLTGSEVMVGATAWVWKRLLYPAALSARAC